MADHRRWELDRFGGALCIDELHPGRDTPLLATDPLQNLPVAFALVAANDQDHMRRFLGNLKIRGLVPGVVVTDGSNLYPAILSETLREISPPRESASWFSRYSSPDGPYIPGTGMSFSRR